ncbi:MAG: hypothetical protein A3C02_01870 [Candidatus Andersenbacteria bacterium RIFCSPHIGHO2_02_FULL_45_11]|uniref:Uncharacterized protein n=1 Tax=Candidatus Andersenbacteria bacterium RIFCSPHIGHO2_12_FULL_45_11 TaxID=1797281 RepID=A0A1G1X3Z2_9BACT|nr:MAG: hypothetical protein A2805_01385 [Candidatus Andersenbacteria bacterium RIFCSPHIGHO2_01_FULL_46_36]OGY32933.1 MAG: hypothetical protein A3C02_01870 [Candidatus Andersenbacteria bacterium RIFCSPHIGHO2_02_FULL_45_11]OGY34719.1 MAG: hypothetical protein A3D99_05290 [Candidatus Andersenbacteria bacterium RIFCSPHIGHO2_12_FULL_45_11]
METASPQRMTIIILGAVLLAAVAVGAVIYFTPTLNVGPETAVVSEDQGSAVSRDEVATSGFDTAVLSQPNYTSLDATLFARGLLPVQPPATAGKPNPFQ